MKDFYATKNAIRTAHHADGRTVTGWIRRPDWPKFQKGKGWPADGVDAVIEKIRAKQAGGVSGVNADLKRAKLQEEILFIRAGRKLRESEQAERQKLLLTMTDHIAEMQLHAGWCVDVFAQWVSTVRVMTGDARLVAEAERLRSAALGRMRERIGNADKA